MGSGTIQRGLTENISEDDDHGERQSASDWRVHCAIEDAR